MKKAIGSIFLFLVSCSLMAQSTAIDSALVYRKRLKTTLVIGTASYASSMASLYCIWYKDYPSSSFHFFDDSREWNQSDKYGHTMAAYGEAKIMRQVSVVWYESKKSYNIWLNKCLYDSKFNRSI